MATPKQIARRGRIEEAAYTVLKESGYKAASLFAIAKRASVSNETLYIYGRLSLCKRFEVFIEHDGC